MLLVASFSIALIVALDHILKAAVLRTDAVPFQVIPGFLELRARENTGILFSLPVPVWILYPGIAVLGVVLAVALIRVLRRRQRYLAIALLLMLIGGASNALDRLLRGAVIDYIDVGGSFTVFNIADLLIVLGIALFLFQEWRGVRRAVP